MQTFSKRNSLKKEYSGYGDASKSLRNRILQLYGHPYSGNEYNFSIGNTNWIHNVAFSKDLQMHFGNIIGIEDFRDETKTTYDQIFDFIEIYYDRAKRDLDSTKRLRLFRDICLAFNNSGSVYEFSSDGHVDLKIEDETAKTITDTDKTLAFASKTQQVFRDLVDGLITRSKKPKDVVKDMCIVFEDYCKKTTTQNTFESAFKMLSKKINLHPIQVKLIENLVAYRGDVWGVAHAGNSPEPKEGEALWYVESFMAQIKYIENELKQLTP